jgi:VWFA-related protein
MRRLMLGGSVIALLVVTGLAAQEQSLQPTLRIGVTAVEIDAVVIDRGGKHVPDLQASDFELLQDGKPQAITGFHYVPIRQRPAVAAPAVVVAQNNRRDMVGPPAIPLTSGAQLRRGQQGRIMAVIVDDLSVSFAEMARMKRALATFIDREMRPDDAVAIISTARGVGQLQQFTNDKAVLQDTVARMQIALMGRDLDDPNDRLGGSDEGIDYNENLQAGSLAAVQNVVRGMRELPGRKSVLFVSSGFALVKHDRGFKTLRPQILAAFRRLVDESNRSFVVIHTLDARGLANPVGEAFLAERGGPAPTPASLSTMAEDYRDRQAGLQLLAEEGGGLTFANNDVNASLSKAMADQEGYYVLAYQPDGATFRRPGEKRPATFHEIKVRVKRSGLQVRARSGFFGVTDAEAHPEPKTSQEQLWNIAASPFISNDLTVRMTPLFGHQPSGDHFRVLLHIDGQGLSFTKSEDGQYRAPVEVMAMLIDGRGAPVEVKMFTFALRTPREPNAARREAGFTSAVEIPAKEPGAYQMRVVLRDVGSNRTGTGYQFVRVPNLSRSRLALSGVELQATPAPDRDAGTDNPTSPAVRRFPASTTLRYAVDAYNAQLDPTNHHPALTVRLRLYRDGALVLNVDPKPIDASPITGDLPLPATLKPGEYQLQLEVTDTRAHGDTATARQWIDFTIAAT